MRLPACALFLLIMNGLAASSEQPLVDFSNLVTPIAWQTVNDDVMGGISTSRFELAHGIAVFHGEVSLENNGGFASVRSLPTYYRFAGCDAFVIRVRGDGRRYKFTARTDRRFDSVLYQAGFETRKGEWEEHRLYCKDFVPSFRGRLLPEAPPLDPSRVVSLGFLISEKQAGPFCLEIAWIHAVKSPRP